MCAATLRRRPASGAQSLPLAGTAVSTIGLVFVAAKAALAAPRGGSACITGKSTFPVALKGYGDAGTPDAYSQPVSAAGVDVGVEAPQRTAQRRAKSPTASMYDSHRQTVRM
jgi:hypothetical protein